jgi:glutamate carboxypeptidase
MSELMAFFQGQQDNMLAMLRELVEIESPSDDKTAVDRIASRVAELMEASGGVAERFPRDRRGDVILGRWPGELAERQILLLCHMDTVWSEGTLAERPVRITDGRFYGPGAFDMKGGIVIALMALQGLGILGRRPVAPVLMLCNGDEEIGSPASRAMIEELATASGLVLCLEPAIPGGALKTARKGVASYTLRVKGRSTHAGADHAKGINAIEEMAHQILRLQALTDYDSGTTVNVGVIQGGTRSNVVPEACEVKVDVRVKTREEAARMTQVISGLRPVLPGTELTVEGGLGHPPMIRDALMVRTFERVRRIGELHGVTVVEGSTGGGSDGSIAAAQGVPTVDGMGPEGDGAHAIDEYVLIESLPVKAALLAAILSQWEFDARE